MMRRNVKLPGGVSVPISGVVSLISDFGSADHYVGVMKGQILSQATHSVLVDISHEVPAFDARAAAYLLEQSFPYMPQGTIHMVVVDPGVGTTREVYLFAMNHGLVLAPHNGILDGLIENRDISAAWRVKPAKASASSTFHGRDVFAPLVGRILAGEDVSDGLEPAGVPDRHDTKTRALVTRKGDHVTGSILWVDRFGNLVTNMKMRDLFMEASRIVGQVGNGTVESFASCYEKGSRQAPFFLTGSSQYLEISLDQGSAAEFLGARQGDPVVLWERGTE